MNDIRKKGLGRGLSALFGDAKSSINEIKNKPELHRVLIGDLKSNQFQPRLNFNEDKLIELSKSIKLNGIIQPIVVRPDQNHNDKFEIIAGERRWLAAQRAGLHEVPIVVLELDDNESLEVSILENIQREDLNPIEEAKGYERLINEFKYPQEKIAEMMSKSRSHVSNTLRLLNLPADIINMLENNFLTAGQARPLIGLSDASQIAEEIVNKRMSARAVESLVKSKKNYTKDLKKNDEDTNILNAQKIIEDKLGLKVTISNRKNNSGKISIEYKNLDQFELISKLLKNH